MAEDIGKDQLKPYGDEAEVDRLRKLYSDQCDALAGQMERVAALTAENERLTDWWRTQRQRAQDAEARLAAGRRALDDEEANLADDGARLSHTVVRRFRAALDGTGQQDTRHCNCDYGAIEETGPAGATYSAPRWTHRAGCPARQPFAEESARSEDN